MRCLSYFSEFKSRRLIQLMALLVCFAAFTGCQSRTTIANNVSERDANEIVVLLNSKGIEAVKSPVPVSAIGGTSGQQMWDINVPASQITEALSILNHAGLPRVKGTSLLDLFGTQGLVPSDLQDRIRYQEGLSEQLATTIRKMDGIIDANVQITFPQEGEERPLTASVYVKHRGILDNPNSLTITKIKRLVASAVPGLTTETVSVVADRALYADISLESPEQKLLEEKEYVSIWGIILAKGSATRFRIIFYTFIILLFLLLCALIWLVWKLFPIIQRKGGLQSLFHPEQFEPSLFAEPKEKEEEEGGGGAE